MDGQTEQTLVMYNVTPRERKAIRCALEVEAAAYNSYNLARRMLSLFPRRWCYVVSSRDPLLLQRINAAHTIARDAELGMEPDESDGV